jgi:hypothetical protein
MVVAAGFDLRYLVYYGFGDVFMRSVRQGG